MTDLNTVLNGTGAGWTLQGAQGGSDNGDYIVGYGLIGGVQHAFLLTSIPEPSACGMLVGGLCLLGLGLVLLRHRSANSKRRPGGPGVLPQPESVCVSAHTRPYNVGQA